MYICDYIVYISHYFTLNVFEYALTSQVEMNIALLSIFVSEGLYNMQNSKLG